MAETVFKGYLIKKTDYRDNDEIITFLDTNGNKHTCISLGSRKITSKNGRNLFLGNFCNFEVFLARSANKVSKLKKCQAIDYVNWRMQMYQPFLLLCECVNKTENKGKVLFEFFHKLLDLINQGKYGDRLTILIILQKYCILNGISLEVNKCVLCGKKIVKSISFKHKGILCYECLKSTHSNDFKLEESKLFYYLFRNEYDQLGLYAPEYDFAIKCLKQYIDDNLGIKFESLLKF